MSRVRRPPLEVDVAIVGGGMVGCEPGAGACRQRRCGGADRERGRRRARRSRASMSAPPRSATAPPDLRSARRLAGDRAARRLPIRDIHVSDAGRFGFARLDAAEQGLEAFGYIAANRRIGRGAVGALARGPEPRAAGAGPGARRCDRPRRGPLRDRDGGRSARARGRAAGGRGRRRTLAGQARPRASRRSVERLRAGGDRG